MSVLKNKNSILNPEDRHAGGAPPRAPAGGAPTPRGLAPGAPGTRAPRCRLQVLSDSPRSRHHVTPGDRRLASPWQLFQSESLRGPGADEAGRVAVTHSRSECFSSASRERGPRGDRPGSDGCDGGRSRSCPHAALTRTSAALRHPGASVGNGPGLSFAKAACSKTKRNWASSPCPPPNPQ